MNGGFWHGKVCPAVCRGNIGDKLCHLEVIEVLLRIGAPEVANKLVAHSISFSFDVDFSDVTRSVSFACSRTRRKYRAR